MLIGIVVFEVVPMGFGFLIAGLVWLKVHALLLLSVIAGSLVFQIVAAVALAIMMALSVVGIGFLLYKGYRFLKNYVINKRETALISTDAPDLVKPDIEAELKSLPELETLPELTPTETLEEPISALEDKPMVVESFKAPEILSGSKTMRRNWKPHLPSIPEINLPDVNLPNLNFPKVKFKKPHIHIPNPNLFEKASNAVKSMLRGKNRIDKAAQEELLEAQILAANLRRRPKPSAPPMPIEPSPPDFISPPLRVPVGPQKPVVPQKVIWSGTLPSRDIEPKKPQAEVIYPIQPRNLTPLSFDISPPPMPVVPPAPVVPVAYPANVNQPQNQDQDQGLGLAAASVIASVIQARAAKSEKSTSDAQSDMTYPSKTQTQPIELEKESLRAEKEQADEAARKRNQDQKASQEAAAQKAQEQEANEKVLRDKIAAEAQSANSVAVKIEPNHKLEAQENFKVGTIELEAKRLAEEARQKLEQQKKAKLEEDLRNVRNRAEVSAAEKVSIALEGLPNVEKSTQQNVHYRSEVDSIVNASTAVSNKAVEQAKQKAQELSKTAETVATQKTKEAQDYALAQKEDAARLKEAQKLAEQATQKAEAQAEIEKQELATQLEQEAQVAIKLKEAEALAKQQALKLETERLAQEARQKLEQEEALQRTKQEIEKNKKAQGDQELSDLRKRIAASAAERVNAASKGLQNIKGSSEQNVDYTSAVDGIVKASRELADSGVEQAKQKAQKLSKAAEAVSMQKTKEAQDYAKKEKAAQKLAEQVKQKAEIEKQESAKKLEQDKKAQEAQLKQELDDRRKQILDAALERVNAASKGLEKIKGSFAQNVDTGEVNKLVNEPTVLYDKAVEQAKQRTQESYKIAKAVAKQKRKEAKDRALSEKQAAEQTLEQAQRAKAEEEEARKLQEAQEIAKIEAIEAEKAKIEMAKKEEARLASETVQKRAEILKRLGEQIESIPVKKLEPEAPSDDLQVKKSLDEMVSAREAAVQADKVAQEAQKDVKAMEEAAQEAQTKADEAQQHAQKASQVAIQAIIDRHEQRGPKVKLPRKPRMRVTELLEQEKMRQAQEGQAQEALDRFDQFQTARKEAAENTKANAKAQQAQVKRSQARDVPPVVIHTPTTPSLSSGRVNPPVTPATDKAIRDLNQARKVLNKGIKKLGPKR